MRKLTEKEKLFVAAYVVDLNAMKAARAAGYKHDHKVACKIIAREPVQAAIVRTQEEKFKRLEIEADDVIRELVKIGFANMKDYVRITGDGEPFVDLTDVTEEQFAAVSEVQVEDFVTGRGDDARDVRRVKFKLHSKQAALESLGKHFGIFEADNHQRVPPNEEVKKSLEDLTPAEAAAEWARMIADV